jgi:hypothetical protein
MKKYKIGFHEAYSYLRKKRAIAKPNQQFQKDLLEWEKVMISKWFIEYLMGKSMISVVVTIEVIKRVTSSFHYSEELVEVKHTVSITIGFFEHLL